MNVQHGLFQVTPVAPSHARTGVCAQQWDQMIMNVTAPGQDIMDKTAQRVSKRKSALKVVLKLYSASRWDLFS